MRGESQLVSMLVLPLIYLNQDVRKEDDYLLADRVFVEMVDLLSERGLSIIYSNAFSITFLALLSSLPIGCSLFPINQPKLQMPQIASLCDPPYT